MKKNIMKKWVKALRSGEYSQGKNCLVDQEDNFCCLGVLCNLSVDDGIGEWVEKEIKTSTYDIFGLFPTDTKCFFFKAGKKKMKSGALPEPVRQWAGMNTCTGHFTMVGLIKSLSNLNDYGSSFDEIADIIEKNYKKL